MNTQTIVIDPDRQWWFRAGGISGIVLGVSYIIITGVYILGGALPEGAEAWLQFLAARTQAWWVILGLSVLTDLLFVPIAVALYVALKQVNKNAMLVGSGLLILFVILDLAVTWPNYAALLTLSGDYAAAATDLQRSIVVGAASYATAVLGSTLFAVYAILVPALGILVISLVMLKGVFGKVTAFLGVGSGILGIIAVVGPFLISGLGIFAVFSSILTTVWVILLGWKLFRLAQ